MVGGVAYEDKVIHPLDDCFNAMLQEDLDHGIGHSAKDPQGRGCTKIQNMVKMDESFDHDCKELACWWVDGMLWNAAFVMRGLLF